MNNLTFSSTAWNEYLYWQNKDKNVLRCINKLLKDIQRNPFNGLGKPEKLKYCNSSWSRRIDNKNRLVYSIDGDNTIILSCRGHYDDK